MNKLLLAALCSTLLGCSSSSQLLKKPYPVAQMKFSNLNSAGITHIITHAEQLSEQQVSDMNQHDTQYLVLYFNRHRAKDSSIDLIVWREAKGWNFMNPLEDYPQGVYLAMED